MALGSRRPEEVRDSLIALRDLTVDGEMAARLDAALASLRTAGRGADLRRVRYLAREAKEALSAGDKTGARAALDGIAAALAPRTERAAAPDIPAAPAPRTEPAAAPDIPAAAVPPEAEAADGGDAAEVPARESLFRRANMAIFNKLRSTFGGENGRNASKKALLEQKRNEILRQMESMEKRAGVLRKELETKQASLNEIVQKARSADRNGSEYERLRHQAMLVKPEIDALSGQVRRITGDIEKLAQLAATYRTGQLNTESVVSERTITEASVLVDQISEQADMALDQARELDDVLSKSSQISQRLQEEQTVRRDAFDMLVSGTPEQAPADDFFSALVDQAQAGSETPEAVGDAPVQEEPIKEL